jgi:ABC-2 type transport system ATP-binding protein
MIELKDIVKEYGWRPGRRVRALDGISLRVPAGSALGIVGPNGAGKSTLIRLLLGYLRPTSGEARVGGMEPRAYVQHHGIGYVPEEVAIPPRWTVRRALEAYAALGEVAGPHEAVDRTLERFELDPLAGRRVGALSKGNRQRLAIAQAFLAERRILLLDEPLNGLDPLWIVRMRALLEEWRTADPARVLIVVSHNLAELERAVDRAAVLVGGRIGAELDAKAGPLEPAFLRALGAAGGGA